MAAHDFSNDRKASWASEVEEDEGATGWDEPPQFAPASVSMPVYPEGPSKPRKNKKKKKNKGNGHAMPGRQDSAGNKLVEAEFKTLSMCPNSMPGSSSPNNASEEADGWQVASSRRIKPVSANSHPASSGNQSLPQSSIQGRSARTSFGPSGQPGATNMNYGDVHAPPNLIEVDKLKTKPLTDGMQPQQTQGKAWDGMQPQQTQGKAWGKLPAVSTVMDVKKTREMNHNILSQLLPTEKSGLEAKSLSTCNTASQPSKRMVDVRVSYPVPELVDAASLRADSESALSDADYDDDSDWIDDNDPCDSDASVKSLETRKQNKWFRSFFDTLDELSNDQIMEHDRQWHCPACHGGVGAIEWYRGLPPLLAHAKTHRTKKIGLHREFAKVLEEDLEIRRTGGGTMPETKFGKWKGLRNTDATKDLMIVWPPMMVIQNTRLDHDDQDKWIGMGNKELLDMFRDYAPLKARHAYGPQGHRGMSILIFGSSPTGYYHAERLAKAFKDDGKGREQWDKPSKIIFLPGGDRILYGYMANAEDMDIFNKHSFGKSKLKWELKKYNEAVALPLTQMDKDSQQLHYYKFKVQKQKEHSKILEKSMSLFTRKLVQREEEITVIRQRARDQHDENQREMDDLERSYRDRIQELQRNITKREREIQEKQQEFQQEHIERYQELEKKLEEEQPKQAKVEEAIARQTQIVELSLRESEDYEYNKRELLKQQHIKKRELMRRQYEETLEFEKGSEMERQQLLDRFSKHMESSTA